MLGTSVIEWGFALFWNAENVIITVLTTEN